MGLYALLGKLVITLNLLSVALAQAPPPIPTAVFHALDRIIECESSGVRDIKSMDVNGRYSYGTLQFQRETFDTYGEKYGLPHEDIYSRAEQTHIAARMLQEPEGWRNWKNCAEKTGVDTMDLHQ
jgi:hypothetical protein